jgi:hypothetical protein
MPLERRHNMQGQQESVRGVGAIWARWWFISTIRWIAWKVAEVNLTKGEKHSRANKDWHVTMVNEEQIGKNSYR